MSHFRILLKNNAIPLIPTMTSNTTPYGIISFSTENGSYPALNVFNNLVPDGGWWFAAGTLGEYVQYQFPAPKLVKSYYVSIASAWSAYLLKASNDGVNFITLDSQLPNTNGLHLLSNNFTYYSYYRLECNTLKEFSAVAFDFLQLYGF